jgi:hypothetical protein
MFKRLVLIGAVALMVGVVAAPAHADTRISVRIGGPVRAVRPVPYPVYAPAPYPVYAASPYPGYVWQPAHYVPTPYGYQMVPGAWVPAAYGPSVVYRPGVVVGPPRGLAIGIYSRGRGRGRR